MALYQVSYLYLYLHGHTMLYIVETQSVQCGASDAAHESGKGSAQRRASERRQLMKILGKLERAAWLTPRNTFLLVLHGYYCTKFGRSASNRLGIGRVPEIAWVPTLGVGGMVTPISPPVLSCHIRSNRASVIVEIRQKFDPSSRVPPFKVTQGHWN